LNAVEAQKQGDFFPKGGKASNISGVSVPRTSFIFSIFTGDGGV
jgi:hypothetical protein